VRLIRVLIVLFACCAAALSADSGPARAEDDLFGTFHALVIGNNDYKHFPKLNTAINDASVIAEVLRKRYGYTVQTLTNATRDDILRKLAELEQSLTDSDNLLIYYAGHGHLDDDADRGYWLPVDADKRIKANWISTADITDSLKASQAWHILVVADSCYSGTLTRSGEPSMQRGLSDRLDLLKRMYRKKIRMAMTSGGEEPVVDGGGSGHSVFANALIDILQNSEDSLTGQELFAQLRPRVMLNADQEPLYSDVRKSGVEDPGGDFVFVPRGWPQNTVRNAAKSTSSERGSKLDDKARLTQDQMMKAIQSRLKKDFETQAREETELMVWKTAQEIGTAEAFKLYIGEYCGKGTGRFCDLARLKLNNARSGIKEPITDCDRFAADPRDPRRIAPGGVERAQLAGDPRGLERAGRACRAAIKDDPENPRIMYQYGRVLAAQEKFEEAAFWYKRAAGHQYVAAQYAIGLAHLRGRGVRQAIIESLRWFGQAAERDYAPALTLLGILHGRGHGVKQDVERAYGYLLRAAQGDPPDRLAQLELGIMFEEGRGGRAPDLGEAHTWYGKAAAAGSLKAKERLAKMKRN